MVPLFKEREYIMNLKHNITKVVSILCLLVVLACGFLPCINITGDYEGTVAGITSITETFNDEALTLMEQLLESQNYDVDLKGAMDKFEDLLEPFNDKQIAIYDFVLVSQTLTQMGEALSGLPEKGLATSGDPTDPNNIIIEGMNGIFIMLASVVPMLPMAGIAVLAPVALFGLLALAVIIRIILRLFSRRGLGVLITLLAILNAAIMVGVPVVLDIVAKGQLPVGLTYTYVPFLMVGCCIASCIIWAIGRNAKAKVVVDTIAEAPAEDDVVEVHTEEVVEEVEEVKTEEVKENVEE